MRKDISISGLMGTYRVKMGANGKLALPKPFMSKLSPVFKGEAHLFLVNVGVIMAVPEHLLHERMERWTHIATSSPGRENEAMRYRRVLADADSVEWSFGRKLIIPKRLLSRFNLKQGSGLTIIGCNKWFEIWQDEDRDTRKRSMIEGHQATAASLFEDDFCVR